MNKLFVERIVHYHSIQLANYVILDIVQMQTTERINECINA